MREYEQHERLHIARAAGCWLEDEASRRYLDGNASVWTNVHGHADPDLNQALRDQLDQVAHVTMLGLNNPRAAELAERLAALTSDRLPRVFFSDCGALAVEVAVKLSLQYWQLVGQPGRNRIIAMEHAYHGDSFGTMALGDSRSFHARFAPWFFDVQRFPAPNHAECVGRVQYSDQAQSLDALACLLEQQGGQTACLLLEPFVQGAAGMRQQPPDFVGHVAALCQQHGIHLILDEIFTGFGRLCQPLAGAAAGVDADFVCVAKGLSGGYLPLGATLARQSVYEAFLGAPEEQRTFFHGQTFTGNPLACAVALCSLAKLEPMIASGDVPRRAALLGTQLAQHFEKHPHVRGLRQLGFAAALDLGPANRSATWPAARRATFHICMEARRRGLILRPLGDSILIVPPIIINDREITFLCGTLRDAIDATAPHL
jgi:adenosylmethionine-8-amino-7-oxononanoate aminotransferase